MRVERDLLLLAGERGWASSQTSGAGRKGKERSARLCWLLTSYHSLDSTTAMSSTTYLALHQATEAQWLKSISNVLPEWGGGLPLELFVQREKLLRETGMGRGLTCW